MLQHEMNTMIHHLQQQHASLQSSINDTKHPGSKAVLVGSILRLERKLHNATLMFQHHIPDIAPLPHAYLPQVNSPSQTLMSPDLYTPLYNDDDDDDDGDDDSGDDDSGDNYADGEDCADDDVHS